MNRSRADPPECLVIFAKPPRAGRVKTRLVGELSAEQAATLHRAFLDDVIDELVGGRFDLRLAWALEEGEAVPTSRLKAMVQEGPDLGARLLQALRRLAAEYSRVAVVGSDHPTLPASLVDLAFDKLRRDAEVVIGPAGDGGYYLLAVRRRALSERLFAEIPWSSSEVLAKTLERCDALGLRVELLPTVEDIDTPEDLARLIEDLHREPDLRCRHTRGLLRSWGRLESRTGEE